MSAERRRGLRDPLDIFDVLKVLEFQLDLGDESFRVRLEIIRSRGIPRMYRANVWRTEY